MSTKTWVKVWQKNPRKVEIDHARLLQPRKRVEKESWKTLSWGMRVPWLYQKCHELSFEPSFIPQIIIKRVKRDHLLIQIPQNCYRLYWLVCSYPLKSRVCHIWQKSKWSLFTIFMMIWGMNDGSNESSWHFW